LNCERWLLDRSGLDAGSRDSIPERSDASDPVGDSPEATSWEMAPIEPPITGPT